MGQHELVSFPVALNLRARPLLLLGGDDEALDKLHKLRAAGARVTLVSKQVVPALAVEIRRAALPWFARDFVESDLEGMRVVVLAERCPELARRLARLRAERGFLFCAIDQPAFSDFYLVSILKRGPLQLGISTGGTAPLLARRIRLALAQGLDQRFAEFCREFGELRARLSALDKPSRKARLEAALDGFAMEVRVRYPESLGAGSRSGEGEAG